MIYVGMDIHKKTTTFCAVDEAGQVIRRGTVSSGEAGWLGIMGHWSRGEAAVALETGSMTWWVVDVLREAGIEPVVVDARQFKMIADSKKKSDRHDARALADGLRGGLAERIAVNVPREKARRARSLMQTRQQILKQRNMTVNAAKAMLRSVGVEMKKAQWPKDAHWEKVLENPAVPIWMKPFLITHRSIWDHLEQQRQDLDALVNEELSHWLEAQLLLEMPGFGPIVTMGILSGIDDVKRFRRSNQLASYAGLIPSSRDSGAVQRRGGITHQGRSLMRYFAVQAAWSAMRSKSLTPSLRKWARRLIVKRGRKVAAVALARRLLVLAHKLLTTGEVYNPTYPVVA
ncbi:MAG: IS110 family transposase [Proteobacteria bacterium]|nr:IS110 family transposase [Pseudomonadota bacterium]MBU1450213.1 IS110 family transposase [Pseudomonadota bacterium]MBU2468611.1 IS110 family transposase [Pseudomonadota bacterium]MBU2517310.1 IS110 family transposase [Pseudomonadota bacterium]